MTTLDVAEKHTRLRVVALDSDPGVCQRLREMGFCEYVEVAKITGGGRTICQVCGVRVALSERLAKAIFVEPLQ